MSSPQMPTLRGLSAGRLTAMRGEVIVAPRAGARAAEILLRSEFP
jgi:hypothetical protein